MSNFDERFMKDEELHSLLEQWKAPDAPQSLDNRVTAAYNSLMGDAAARHGATASGPRCSPIQPLSGTSSSVGEV